ncbi:MAG TPA: addiction module protein [Rubrivivax sp.]|nr:addiction module protein [Rubrivivax sp.]
MSATLESLQAQILCLSKADRSRLLERLIASLEVDAAAEAQWERVAEARDEELRSAAVTPVTLEDAMARLRASLPG